MAFPTEQELKKIRKVLRKAKPTMIPSETPSEAEKIKYTLCQKFIEYIIKHRVSQIDLAKKLNIDPARINDIVKYRVHLFTIDKLLEYTLRLDPKTSIKIA